MSFVILIDIISVLFIAILLDFALGEPPNKIHPVVFIGKAISFFTKLIKRFSQNKGRLYEKIGGSILALGLPVIVGLIVYFIIIQ